MESDEDGDQQVAANLEKRVKGPKKFMFPIMHKEFNQDCLKVCKAMVKRYIEKNTGNRSEDVICRVQNGAAEDKDKSSGNETNEISNSVSNGENEKRECNGNKPEEANNKIENGLENKNVDASEIRNGVDTKEDQKQNANETEEVANGLQNDDAEKKEEEACNFVKIFGSINEVNELLDAERK